MAMSEQNLDRLVDRFVAHHARFNPVDASFIGWPGHDHRLPPAGLEAGEEERDGIAALQRDLDALPPGTDPAGRIEARMVRAALAHASAALDHWPRAHQPSWYTGEVAFGLISLLLPGARDIPPDAVIRRLEAAPAFLAAGTAMLAGRPTPADWCERARRESAAIARLTQDLRLHPSWTQAWAAPAERLAKAVDDFARGLDGLPPGEPACGRDYLSLLMREVHGLPWSPEEAVAMAADAFAELGSLCDTHPARDAPADAPVEADALPAAYRHWHERALADAAGLVTPARDFALTFQPLPDWARGVAGELYFLSYRCPSALAPGAGSIYWTAPVAQPSIAIKQTHALHHGSIGHHTQNARARQAASRLARFAGNDCASGVALLSAGTMIEGWSCYATELAAEVDGFYTPQDDLASLQAIRRNAGSVLADIGLHAGGWGLERMRSFYRDEAGFPAGRVLGETTRNSILPATRLMYWLGTHQIRELRREIGGEPRAFHDALLDFGHVPVSWAADELRRARASAP
jgi:hypothetical protein